MIKRFIAGITLTVGAVLAASLPFSAAAQPFPNKAIRIIVPFSAGGTMDLLARLVGQKLSERFGQPVVVENKPGANGIIGTDLVAKAPPDGYTLGVASPGTHAANQYLYKSLPYDTVKDFTPVTLAISVPMLLVVNPALKVNSVKEFIAAAKAKPGTISYASGGSGSSPHLAMELFNLMAGININHIPYKGTAPSYPDLISGRVQAEIDVTPTALPQVKAGHVKALATASAKRLQMLPNIPTIAEAGVPGYEYDAWYGFVAPANLPKEILDKLHSEIVRALKQPDVARKLAGDGIIVVASTPEEFSAHIKSEMEKAAKIIKAANIKAY